MNNLTLDSICGVNIYQKKSGYRFSLDPVLLAWFCRFTRSVKLISDLGSGSGVIALILAKQYPWISGVLAEIQEELVSLSGRNAALNGLNERLRVVMADISLIPEGIYPEMKAGLFDAVVTNPPFRRPDTGRISPYKERARARHETGLTLNSIIKSASYLLKNRGRLFMVYHPYRLSELISVMHTFSLEPKRMRFVHPYSEKDANMVLVEALRGGGTELKVEPPMFIYKKEGGYTDEALACFQP